MIYRIDSPLLIPKMIDLAKRTAKEDDVPFDGLSEMLIDGVSSDKSRIYVDERKGVVVGFIYASIEYIDARFAVYIQYCSVDPFAEKETDEQRSIFDELLAKILKWGEELNFDYIYMGTRRPRASKRRAKFDYWTTMMRRKIKNGKPIQESKTATAVN